MKKGNEYEAVISKYEFPNKGIAWIEEQPVVIKGALQGQRVRCRINKYKKGKAEARLLEVLEASVAETASPKCKYYGVCGGCSYQTLPYETQLAIKESQVKALLDDVCTEYQWEGIHLSPNAWAYRNKMEFSFGDEYKDGPLALGLHKKGSFYDLVTLDSCQIVQEDYHKVLQATLAHFAKYDIPYYKKMSHQGILRHLVVRQTAKTRHMLINLVVSSQSQGTEEEMLHLQEWQDRLLKLELAGEIKGILLTINDSLADVVQPDEVRLLYGEEYITEEILGLSFKITPFSFFQTNSLGAEQLYSIAREYVGDTKDQVVFDLYSGTGTIAQMLAKVAKKVVGVEIIEEAVESAKENARLNRLENCEFIAGDVMKVLDGLEDMPDMIVLDPPRDGVHPKALSKIINYGVENIVYISCKPTSLARDLVTLQAAGYKIKRACCMDMFPQTVNVETCALLTRTGKMNEQEKLVNQSQEIK